MAISSGTQRGQLLAEGQPIDLVYNRLVDFSFGNPEHQDLRAAYLDDAVVVTQVRPGIRSWFPSGRC